MRKNIHIDFTFVKGYNSTVFYIYILVSFATNNLL